MLTYIDHVTLAVRSLDSGVERFRSGLSFFVGGRHRAADAGLETAVIPLVRGHLELISALPDQTNSAGAGGLSDFLSVREGLYGYAVQSSDVADDVASLRSRGSRLVAPQHETVERNGVTIGWTVSEIPEREVAGPLPFLVQYDASPDEQGRRAALTQPLAIRSIEEVTVVVSDVEATLTDFERDFGLRTVRRLGARAQVGLLGSKITLVPARMAPLGLPLGLYSAALGTTDINGARTELRARDIPCVDDPFSLGVAVQIDPAFTCGARIGLVQL